ncbi:MAG: hypothetical protein IJY46_02750 [Lentisphaeria bacterium]|nr:hypothetical protein [Lentisphaeria bacterium]
MEFLPWQKQDYSLIGGCLALLDLAVCDAHARSGCALRRILVVATIFAKNDLRRRLAGNLTGKSADVISVMDSSPLLRCRLDLPATLLHDSSAGRVHDSFERSFTGGAAHSARAFCLRKTKSDKITFSESNFLPLKKFRKQVFC